MVVLDGSLWSWGGFKTVCDIVEKSGRFIEIVVVYTDDSIAQELLDVHVVLVCRMVMERDISVLMMSFNGFFMVTIGNHVECANFWLFVVGRHGVDVSVELSELGSVVEYMIRIVSSNVLVVVKMGLFDEMVVFDLVHSIV